MLTLACPIVPMRVISGYGPRPAKLADGRAGPLHPGTDFGAELGQPVYAVRAGTVLESRLSCNDPPDWRPGDKAPRVMGYGNTIKIAHQDEHAGFVTRYAHMSRRLVDAGEHVERGQTIGFAGATGYSFGTHLHFELRLDGGRSLVDPMDPKEAVYEPAQLPAAAAENHHDA